MPNGLPYAVLWLIAAVVLAVVEASTLGLVTLWFAVGAIFAMIGALLGVSFQFQVIIFIVSSGILLYFTRPIVKNYLKVKTERTNADRLIGRSGRVIEEIDDVTGTGQVKVSGQIWSARSEDGSNIQIDENIEVQEISGVKLLVKKQ